MDSLIERVDLPVMDEPFTKEEIDLAVKEMASDLAQVHMDLMFFYEEMLAYYKERFLQIM